MSEKLNNLQQFVQNAADTAWRASQNNSQYDPNPIGFDQHLEFTLQARSGELAKLLNEIAEDELSQVDRSPEPIDFTKFVRISDREFNHKEVFVGDKWVLIPSDASINFEARTDSYAGNLQASFTVTISHGGNTATYTSSETYQQFQNNKPLVDNEQLLVKGKNLRLNDGELDWMRLGGQIYGITDKSANNLNNSRVIFNHTPNEFKRTYSYKLSKLAKNVGKPAKSGKIFQGTQKLAKNAKFLGPLGNILTIGTIGYEYRTDSWDAHTFVNGAILVVGLIAAPFGAGVILTGIAIYGLLDLVFDVGDGIDDLMGRDSGFWDNRPINFFPIDANPIFKIDNTYVAPQLIMPLK
ncbi:hypothetical protein QUH73_04135 [Labilibaculum sp. K2S]|uniref:hypothetical protein n=1 Tax=Labilibaculum sp. K2S TaxID=3056386 RepID=UPI0025A36C29|nr:hypothetical protein [Labilibaculum sp. K2S]MDM8159004.1 hypothetical protein [Labilibaculum sp. K2S]